MDVFSLALRISEVGGNAALNAMERLEHKANETSEAVNKIGERMEFLSVAATAAMGAFAFEKIVEATGAAQQATMELQGSVENAGASWAAWQPILDGVAETMLSKTRFGVDETKKALGTLITVTGSARTAYNDIGLAADIAAKRHMDLGAAAEIVGRIEEGQTRLLRQFGITTTDVAAGMEQLRAMFGGFAEKEGAGVSDSLTRSGHLLEELSKTVGEVAIGTDVMTGATEGFNQAVIASIGWVKANNTELHALSDVLGSIGSRIGKGAEVAITNLWQAFKEAQVALIAFEVGLRDLGWLQEVVLGDMLRRFGNFAEQVGTAFDRLFGTNLAERAGALADAGNRMIREGNQQVQFLERAAKATADQIFATTEVAKKSAETISKLPFGGKGHPTSGAADAADATEKQLKDQKALVEVLTQLHDLHAMTDVDYRAGLALEETLSAELAKGNVSMERRAEILKELNALQKSVNVGKFSDVTDTPKPNKDDSMPLQMEDIPDRVNKYLRSQEFELLDMFKNFGVFVAQGFQDALTAGFSNLSFSSFGDTLLKSLGGILVKMGVTMIGVGLHLAALLPHLLNPFTSGPAMVIAGTAIALAGGAISHIAMGGSDSGTSASSGAYGGSYGAGGGYGGGYDTLTPVTLNGTTAHSASQITPAAPVTNHFTVIGTEDPRAQRQIVDLIQNAVGRGFTVRGIAG